MSLVFDESGGGTVVQTGNDSQLDYASGEEYLCSFWLTNPSTGLAHAQTVYSYRDLSIPNTGHAVRITTKDEIELQNGIGSWLSTLSAINANVHHVLIYGRSGGDVYFYVDGALDVSRSTFAGDGTPGAGTTLYVGARWTGFSAVAKLDSGVRDLAFCEAIGSGVTVSDIADLAKTIYDARISPWHVQEPIANLIVRVHWDLQFPATGTFVNGDIGATDLTGNGNNLTNVGTGKEPSWGADQYGGAGILHLRRSP